MLPGSDDTGDDNNGDDNERNDNLVSKWLLPSSDEENRHVRRRRRQQSSGSQMSNSDQEEEEDLISVLTNPTSVGTNDSEPITEVRHRSVLFVFDLDQTLVSSGRHGAVVADEALRREMGRVQHQCLNNNRHRCGCWATSSCFNKANNRARRDFRTWSEHITFSTLHRSMSARPTSGGLMHSNSSSLTTSLYRTSSMPFSSVPAPLDPNVYVNPETGEREVLLYRGEDSSWDLMYIKLRPGVRQLLSQSRQIADLAIFSAASPDYVQFIARKLDPNGYLFDGRVYSSKELGIGTSKTTEVLPAGYDRIVIIDDNGSIIWNDVDHDVCCFPSVPPYTFMRDHIADILNGIYPPDDDHFLIGELLPQLSSFTASLNAS